ncbi:taspase, threonine aspartase, 1 [Nematocida sp. AWRm80]|nr:taspase, threonine aspartase, 1 [Nematocida sp. AWRm80]
MNTRRIIAVHAGAGRCTRATGAKIKKALKRILEETDNLITAIQNIEESGLCNCGTGSNLTRENTIENEACIATSTGDFSSLCLIPLPYIPSRIAKYYLDKPIEQGYSKPLSLVFTKELQQEIDKNNNNHQYTFTDTILLNRPSLKESNTSNSSVSLQSSESTLDTVGGIEITNTGSIALSSSGGLNRKYSGRIGPCSIYAANTICTENISVLLSGTGEALIRTMICARIFNRLLNDQPEDIKLELDWYLEQEKTFPHIGGIAIYNHPQKQTILLIHFQTAPSFLFAYSDANNKIYSVYHHQKSKQSFVNILSL